HAAYITAVLDQARRQRDAAFAKLSAEERRFLFDWPENLVPSFYPQAAFDEASRPRLAKDRAFFSLAPEKCDWAQLAGAARTLALLTEPGYLAALKKALEAAKPIAARVPGVTGDILYHKETRHGLVLFGGKGANVYDLRVPVAFLADLGGDDIYQGKVASSFD